MPVSFKRSSLVREFRFNLFPSIFTYVCVQITVTWTSGYGTNEAEPFVEWGLKGGDRTRSPAGTLTFDRNSMCGV